MFIPVSPSPANDHDPSGISGQKELRSARVAVNTTQM
jgi:hypothetical protein